MFCYYIVLTVIDITTGTLELRDSDKLVEGIVEYFICESTAPENPCDTSFRDYAHTELSALAFVLLGFLPTALLIFVISVKDVKKWCSYASYSVSEKASTSTTSNLKQSRIDTYR